MTLIKVPKLKDVTGRLLADERLVELHISRAPMPGIYFLCLADAIQYVGKSVNVASRVCAHIDRPDWHPPRKDRGHDEVAWVSYQEAKA